MTLERIGFIGLGTMGKPMAKNLLAAGFDVCVFQRKEAEVESLLAARASARISLVEVAAGADVIVLMLPDDKAVSEVVLSNDGIAQVAVANQIVVDCSTVHPDTSRKCSCALAECGAWHLDAPVTGSRPQAEGKQLAFLVGGERNAFDLCRALFEAMGKRHTYLGPSGAGTSTKLAANLMGATHLLALKEAMAIVRNAGIDPATFLEVVSNSGARSAMADAKGPKILNADWTTDFALKLMLKDVKLARTLASLGGEADLQLIDSVVDAYTRAVETWGGDGDVCAVARRGERNQK